MRNYLAKLGNIKPSQEFDLIKLLGKDLPGAVTISSPGGKQHPVKKSKQGTVTQTDQKPYRFSLAGVQIKFSAIAKEHGGLTIPAEGVEGNWIVKLPAQNYSHVPENEWSMMHLAKEIGIPIPKINLVICTGL